MLNAIASFLGFLCAILSMSLIGLLSLVAPNKADNITDILRNWAEND